MRWRYLMDKVRVRQLIIHNEIEKAIELTNNLSSDELNSTIEYLLRELLETSDGNDRNMIAYFLGEIKCQKAADVLVTLIFNEELKNNRGTLISALGKLESKPYVYRLLPLLYEGNYEVVMNTYMLLQDHVPEIDSLEHNKCVEFISKKIEYYEDILSTLYDVYENIFGQELED